MSRTGITLFDGAISEFDGKVINPGALQIAQLEGLRLKWDYEEPDRVLSLHLRLGSAVSDPVLRIPLSEDEAKLLEGHLEKGGWGYYELVDDDRAAVHVSFMNADDKPVSLLWIVSNEHRMSIRDAMDRFVGIHDPIFGEPPGRSHR